MKGLIIKALNKCVHLLSENNRPEIESIQAPEKIQAQRVKQWFTDEGDKTHRLNYDELNSDSLVIDLGGYEGQWASDIYSKYNCFVMIFEPYIPYAKNIEYRFKKNDKIKVFRFGLGARNENVSFSLLDNASSVYGTEPKTETIQIVSVTDFIKENNVTSVDLMKINIEGGEYELLEEILNSSDIKIFKNIQVQFHDFIIPNASERMKAIQNKLALTHELTYHYEFVWDNWRIKEA